MTPLPQEIIRLKRDGHPLAVPQIDAFVDGRFFAGGTHSIYR